MRHLILIYLSIAVLISFAAHGQTKGDWTGWLGPQRTGWVDGFRPPSEWPDQLNRGWQVEVGTGYGSPLVVGDSIYIHARQDPEEVVWCLNRKDGAVKWRQSFPMAFRTAPGGEFHGNGPKSSPVFADGRLFTMSIDGTLSAWDGNSGKRLWHKNYDSEFGKNHPNWGASTSPVVDGNRVIVHFGTDETGTLVALDVESGKEIWRHGEDGPSYSSPLVVEIDGVRQVVEWNHRALVGVEMATGRFLWEFPFPHVGSNQNMPTPAFHQGIVLLGGENRGIHGIQPRLEGGEWKVTDLWHEKSVALNMSSAVMNGDHLYGLSHRKQGSFFCLEPHTGKVLWQGPPRSGQNVMFLSMQGYVAALVNKFEEVVSYRVADDRTWAPPVFMGEGILIKDHKHLTFWSGALN